MGRGNRHTGETPLADRFWPQVDQSSGPRACWPWLGYRNRHGYGQTSVKLAEGWTKRHAHRVAYELAVGPIPEGLDLDHLCRVRACVNPAHLEPVTRQENVLRSPIALQALNARKTHCDHGHPFDVANTYRWRGRWRTCRTCNAAHQRARKARLRLEATR